MKTYLLLATMLFSLPVIAQDEDADDDESESVSFDLPPPDWKAELKKGKITGYLYSNEAPKAADRYASSHLEKYPATNLSDNNLTTAWADGVDGAGVGEIVVVAYPSDIIWIWSGYGKSQQIFSANNRPAKIKVHILGTYCHDCTRFVCTTSNLNVLAAKEYTLKDLNGFQSITLPKVKMKDNTESDCPGRPNDPEQYHMFVAIEILSVYKGTKYNDTCITEIMSDDSYKQWLTKKQKSK